MNPVQPYRQFIRNEGTAILLDLTHLDKDGALDTPTAVSYRIDDLTSVKEVLDWTSINTPSSTNTITITAAQNAINSRSQEKELRQVTVNATDSTGTVVQDIFIYTLIRIFDKEDQLI